MASEKQKPKETESENKNRKSSRSEHDRGTEHDAKHVSHSENTKSHGKSESRASKDEEKSQAKSNRQSKRSESKLEPGKSGKTTDHEVIRRWVEERGGRPATVKATEGKSDPGLLRIDFPDRGAEDRLDDISWEEFFDKFEEKKLAFLYQEETRTGRVSRFSKFVSRGNEK